MNLPFTAEEFFQVFGRYNAAIWPAQLAGYAFGIAAFLAAWGGGRRASAFVALALAAFWAMAGGGYHLGFFRAINPLANLFGGLFLVQAVLFAASGLRGQLSFGASRDGATAIAAVCACYAMLVYPALNVAAGHALASSPVFGVAPCPVTIFTFGVLLLARSRLPLWLLPVPLAWSLVGVSAALQLRVPADYGLGVAGAVGTGMLLAKNRRLGRANAPAAQP